VKLPGLVRRTVAVALVAAATIASRPSPTVSYLFYVASESDDVVTLVRFTPGQGLTAEKVIPVGWLPAEIEAPHGVFVDPDGSRWYLTLGHGFPFGHLVKYATGADSVIGMTELGLFPATVSVPKSGGVAFAVNSDFHGDMKPSTVSVIDLETMTELDKVETCTMPHGSRFSPDGMTHYSACMMDDQLVAISLADLTVSHRLDLVTGQPPAAGGHAGHEASRKPCSPTWVAPHPDGRRAYVPCNKGNEVVEVDLQSWSVLRRFPAPKAPYNADVSPDGKRLLVTQKGSAEVSVFDLERGERIAAIPTTRTVTHGVVVSPDNRFAFVTVEGVRGEPGTVEAIDLGTMARVSALEVGKQAGGIAFWKTIDR